jgi:hypothetical protein
MPEQREMVVRRTALLELAGHDRAEGTLTERVRERVRLHALTRGRRDELSARALQTVDELVAAVAPQGAEGAVASAVVDAALGLAHVVDLFVLTGLEEQTDADRRSAGLLADELAGRGATVLVVGPGAAAPPTSTDATTNGTPNSARHREDHHP